MADFSLGDVMERLLEMEKESIADVAEKTAENIGGAIYWPYHQESFPYWHNHLDILNSGELAADIAHDQERVIARLVMGHITEGYEGELLSKTYDYITAVRDYFADRPGMNSNAHSDEMDFVFPGLELTGHGTAPAGFPNSGIPGITQVGIEFYFNLPIISEQIQ